MSQRVTVTEVESRLSDLLDQVRDGHETFVILRGGEEVGRLMPVEPNRPLTLLGLLDLLRKTDSPDPQFADDLEEIQASQPPAGDSPWAS